MSNPNPSPETRFTSDRSEPLTSKITIRITDSMLEELKKQDNYREFIREAIAQRLAEVKSSEKLEHA